MSVRPHLSFATLLVTTIAALRMTSVAMNCCHRGRLLSAFTLARNQAVMVSAMSTAIAVGLPEVAPGSPKIPSRSASQRVSHCEDFSLSMVASFGCWTELLAALDRRDDGFGVDAVDAHEFLRSAALGDRLH